MAKGFKMLKYIMRHKDLRRIPMIMMTAQDEVALVVKCLRLGAADYLVKPLRTNELLNLWTHMCRRRLMLGLAEKNIMNCEFDLVPSDPSDANTNSTNLFSDDTDDMSHKSSNPEIFVSIHQETDPEDIIWDEIVGKDEHPEEGDGYKFQETDLNDVIRDKIIGKEEHPEECDPKFVEKLEDEFFRRRGE